MRTIARVVGIIVVFGVGAAAASMQTPKTVPPPQNPPPVVAPVVPLAPPPVSFAGIWVFDRDRSQQLTPDGHMSVAPMLGQRFTATQDATAGLTLTITSGTLVVTAIYKLDGTDSKNMSPDVPGQPYVEVTSHASWQDTKLVIVSTSTSTGADGASLTIESKRVMWLDEDGSLIIERTGTPAGVVVPTRTVYTKPK